MLKLLFIPTGNIFILPDEEALRIKREDRTESYKIIDAGYQEEKTEVVSPKTVQELVMKQEDDEEEQTEENEVIEEVKNDNKFKNLSKLSKKELIDLCKRAGLIANINDNKQRLIERLKQKGFAE